MAVRRFHPYMETLPPKKEIGHILAAEHAVRDASRDDSMGKYRPSVWGRRLLGRSARHVQSMHLCLEARVKVVYQPRRVVR